MSAKRGNLLTHFVAIVAFVGLPGIQLLYAQNTSISADMVPIGGTNSLAVGFEALRWNSGIGNTAMGHKALQQNTTGKSNTAAGFQALIGNTSGGANTAMGYLALFSNATGGGNSALGYQALAANTNGSYNTALGYQAMYKATNSSGNTSVGNASLWSNLVGINNTSLGDSAGYMTTGNGNLFLGRRAGFSETGSNKLYVANNDNNTLIYGDFNSGQILMGNKAPTGYSFKGSRTLNVAGGILADSVRVAHVSNWADYVFDEAYDLPSIHKLEEFIKANKHLPNIPSAKEVAENGIEFGDINRRLLEKIEQLVLYVISQEKRIEGQASEISELKKLIRSSK